MSLAFPQHRIKGDQQYRHPGRFDPREGFKEGDGDGVQAVFLCDRRKRCLGKRRAFHPGRKAEHGDCVIDRKFYRRLSFRFRHVGQISDGALRAGVQPDDAPDPGG